MDHDSQRSSLIAQAETAKAIMAAGAYRSPTGIEIDLHQALGSCRTGTTLVRPAEWAAIHKQAVELCQGTRPASIEVTEESTLAALERLAFSRSDELAALNFASARRPGGGWDTGARAQEETLARASGLITCLEAAPGYYAANRQHEHLFYTDHAIWSPAVPFFARDDGTLLPAPYTAGIITMPAPNLGGMSKLLEQDVLALRGVWMKRITSVLALAIVHQVRHLVLGAWGCGAFGNDPLLVARCFRDALSPSMPWSRGFDALTFAVLDQSRHRSCFSAFRSTLTS